MSTHNPRRRQTPQYTEPIGAALSRRSALKVGASGLAAFFTFGRITPALAAELSELAGSQPMTAARLASILKSERAKWNELLALVGEERMDVPGAAGDWSVKQLVAHLTWYEQAVVEGAQAVLQTGAFRRRRREGVSLDQQNAEIAEQSRSRSAAEVLAEADLVFEQLLTVVAACPDEILNDPSLLRLPEDVVPWMGVADNSYAHYRHHEEGLRAWLASNPIQPAWTSLSR